MPTYLFRCVLLNIRAYPENADAVGSAVAQAFAALHVGIFEFAFARWRRLPRVTWRIVARLRFVEMWTEDAVVLTGADDASNSLSIAFDRQTDIKSVTKGILHSLAETTNCSFLIKGNT